MSSKVPEIISVQEAARRMKRTPTTIMHALRHKKFPVGTCFETAAGRFVYIIPREAFERFMQGEIDGHRTEGDA